jgi:hypothetical protein
MSVPNPNPVLCTFNGQISLFTNMTANNKSNVSISDSGNNTCVEYSSDDSSGPEGLLSDTDSDSDASDASDVSMTMPIVFGYLCISWNDVENIALHQVIAELWVQYLEVRHGQDPVKFLFISASSSGSRSLCQVDMLLGAS